MLRVSGCPSLQKVLRVRESSRSRMRKSSALGRPAEPQPQQHPCGDKPALLPPGQCRARCCLGALVPESSGHCGSRPAGRWSACSQPSWPALPPHPQNPCCSSHCRQAQGEGLRTEPGLGRGVVRGATRVRRTPSSPPHHSPAHVHLQGRQGAGRHDPGRHAEHHGVREDGGFGEILRGKSRGEGAEGPEPGGV